MRMMMRKNIVKLQIINTGSIKWMRKHSFPLL